MARRILRDRKKVAEEIRLDMQMYLKYARSAYVQMLKDILPDSDYGIDGTKTLKQIVEEVVNIIRKV